MKTGAGEGVARPQTNIKTHLLFLHKWLREATPRPAMEKPPHKATKDRAACATEPKYVELAAELARNSWSHWGGKIAERCRREGLVY